MTMFDEILPCGADLGRHWMVYVLGSHVNDALWQR